MSEEKGRLRRFAPVPFTQVEIEDEFWAPRLKVNRKRTLFAEYEQCRKTGRIDAFKMDWKPGMEPAPHMFWDSDVAKWVEAASYSLATHPDPKLEALVDEVVSLVVSAQQPDGYLNVHFTLVEPEKRWTNLRDHHELYTAGHLMEAAVAHHQATGKRNLLEATCRFADYIGSVFGAGSASAEAAADRPGQKRGYCGHEEIELALVRLYRATGGERYLRLSQYFVEERGRQPHYYDLEARERGGDAGRFRAADYSYCQAHLPVREQTEAVGHSVRAMYLYSAMADLAAELNDPTLLAACERLWESVCLRKMYLTGGIGSVRGYEGFGPDYDLPNDAYAETCAAIGLVLWNHRMLQFDCDGRYADVMERALYNGVISGVSLDGERFFYENPLVSEGKHHRQEWFECACCPPNLARLLASLGGYAYSCSGERPAETPGATTLRGGCSIAIHLYIGGDARTALPSGAPVCLAVDTRYPWEGSVRVEVGLTEPQEFTLRLRIPGWCRKHALAVDGVPFEAPVEKGYACVTRTWRGGDVVELEMDMPVERIEAHPSVQQDRGRVALQRGPIVYCFEGVDNPAGPKQVALPDEAALTARFDASLLGGVVVIEGEGRLAEPAAWEGALYRPAGEEASRAVPVRAVPYCVWDNREAGEMVVWVGRQ